MRIRRGWQGVVLTWQAVDGVLVQLVPGEAVTPVGTGRVDASMVAQQPLVQLALVHVLQDLAVL